jgi:hypothetical protein
MGGGIHGMGGGIHGMGGGIHGMGGGIHGMSDGIHGMSDGIHGMSDGIHGMSRWNPYHFQVDSMECQMDSMSFPDGFHTISRVESIGNPCN